MEKLTVPSFHDYWLGLPREEREELAQRAGTSYGYLEKLAGGFGLPGLLKAARIARGCAGLGGMTEPLPIESFLAPYETRHGAP